MATVRPAKDSPEMTTVRPAEDSPEMTTVRAVEDSPFRTWERPDGPSRCTYHDAGSMAESPHDHVPFTKTSRDTKVMSSILEAIGHTPLVQLNRIARHEGITCQLLAKCEYLNPGGSIKDRIGLRMVEDAEERGILKQGDVFIEPTAGNTGISLAMVAAVKNYRSINTMPSAMSNDKEDVMKALGSEVVRTTGSGVTSPHSDVMVAKRLMEETPNSHLLDQHRNPSNPLAHYDGTAEEILAALDDKIDMIILGAGTGGTLTGISRKVKARCPSCKIVVFDPEGSVIAEPEELNKTELTSFEVEGAGRPFIPTVCDRKLVDKWYKIRDKDIFVMARRLISEEGLLCGGTSGASVHTAVMAIRDFGLKEGQTCVVILPDSVRNYMTKFLSDEWMTQRGYMEREIPVALPCNRWWWDVKVSALDTSVLTTVTPTVTIQDTLDLLNKERLNQIPVVSELNDVLGIVTIGNILDQIVNGKVRPNGSVSEVINKQFKKVRMDASLGQLSRMLATDHFVLVVPDQRQSSRTAHTKINTRDFAIATKTDLVNFITKRQNCHMAT